MKKLDLRRVVVGVICTIIVLTISNVTFAWGGDSNLYLNTHFQIADDAFETIYNDKRTAYNVFNESCYNSYTKSYQSAQSVVRDMAHKEDQLDGTLTAYRGHFYGVDGKNYLGQTSPTAYTQFNEHFYNAVTKYKAAKNSSDKYYAYNELGSALHYVADLNAPHHAANKIATNTNHTTYETWVNKNYSLFRISTAPQSTYDYCMNSTFKKMADDFSANARAQINNALVNDPVKNKLATQETLPKAQRASAAILYRFAKAIGKI